MIGTSYILTNIEAESVQLVAEVCYTRHRKAGDASALVSGEKNFIQTRNAFASELAFCKIANIEFVPQTMMAQVCSVVYKGLNLDVKSTKLPDGRMLGVASHKSNSIEAYVLVTGDFPGPYTVRGFCTKDELYDESNLDDFGYGPTYVLGQRWLHELEDPCTNKRGCKCRSCRVEHAIAP